MADVGDQDATGEPGAFYRAGELDVWVLFLLTPSQKTKTGKEARLLYLHAGLHPPCTMLSLVPVLIPKTLESYCYRYHAHWCLLSDAESVNPQGGVKRAETGTPFGPDRSLQPVGSPDPGQIKHGKTPIQDQREINRTTVD